MTFSQKIAALLTVTNGLLCAAITASAIIFTVMSFEGVSGWGYILFVMLIIFLIPYVPGTALLIGYFLHWRGKLSKILTGVLWIGTIIYNLVGLALVAPTLSNTLLNGEVSYNLQNLILIFIFAVYLIATIALAVAAFWQNCQTKN